ncbi:hypothetical protein [Flavobacterium aquiphilum]|uniref:hypothetical protein n=1 Tax=Flavobacterium aquiphilum TaxID=3003261 RepID=UPI0024813413|nr:hypothetical protein [Flavobacterium aquiphilum]
MNKKLKTIIIIINVIMLFVAGYWLYRDKELEPLTVVLSQGATILILFFENSITKKFEAGNLLDSELEVENKDEVKMNDITKSKVKIK